MITQHTGQALRARHLSYTSKCRHWKKNVYLGGVNHYDCILPVGIFVSSSPAKYIHTYSVVNVPNNKGSSSISLPSTHSLYTLTAVV